MLFGHGIQGGVEPNTGARIWVLMEETLEECLMAPIEYVEPVLMEDRSENYAASEHWNKYWNTVSAPSDNECPEVLTDYRDKLLPNDKLMVPEKRVEALMNNWNNVQLLRPGRDKMQRDLQWRFEFPSGYYAILNRYCNDCAMCRATKSPHHSTAGNPVDTAIPESPMRSIVMDVFAMPEVTVEGKKNGCIISAVYRHSGYIYAAGMHIPWLNTSQVPPIPVSLT